MEESRNALFCVENNETFMKGTYNGVSIIYRVSDKYVNVSHLCNQAGKKFYGFTRGKRWNEILKYWIENEGIANLPPVYEIHKKYNKAQGIYVHSDLIHFVAEWISIEYAFKVAKIMNLINERNQLTNKSLEDTTIDLQDEID